MKQLIYTPILFLCFLTFNGLSQSLPENCELSSSKPEMRTEDNTTIFSYSELGPEVHCLITDERIDSILAVTNGEDTLKRFFDSGVADFEEILPMLGIADWEILIRLCDYYPEPQRESEFRNLTRTYAILQPHLYGVFNEGTALVRSSEGYNFIDRKGNLLFDCHFENATNFIDGKAYVKMDGTFYLIDKEGKFYPIEEK